MLNAMVGINGLTEFFKNEDTATCSLVMAACYILSYIFKFWKKIRVPLLISFRLKLNLFKRGDVHFSYAHFGGRFFLTEGFFLKYWAVKK